MELVTSSANFYNCLLKNFIIVALQTTKEFHKCQGNPRWAAVILTTPPEEDMVTCATVSVHAVTIVT